MYLVCLRKTNEGIKKSFRIHLHLNKSMLNRLLIQQNVLFVIKQFTQWKKYAIDILFSLPFEYFFFIKDRSRQKSLSQSLF
jgi:hypothetical protein